MGTAAREMTRIVIFGRSPKARRHINWSTMISAPKPRINAASLRTMSRFRRLRFRSREDPLPQHPHFGLLSATPATDPLMRPRLIASLGVSRRLNQSGDDLGLILAQTGCRLLPSPREQLEPLRNIGVGMPPALCPGLPSQRSSGPPSDQRRHRTNGTIASTSLGWIGTWPVS